MSLSPAHQVVLWGPPLLTLLLTVAYYLRWGKEADERAPPENGATDGGGS